MASRNSLRISLSVLLSLILVLSLFPISAQAATSNSGSCGKFLKWNLKDGTLTISGRGEMTDYSSSKHAPWSTLIKRVRIEEGVTSIGDYAFKNCSKLSSVELPESLTDIGSCAFRLCAALTEFTIPDSVTSIGDYAFCACKSLSSVTIPDSVTSIGDRAFAGCPLLVLTVTRGSYPEAYCWNDDLSFRYVNSCGKDLSWMLKDGTLTISGSGEMADYNGDDLPWDTGAVKELVIEDGVTSIGDYAFAFCNGLSSVTIPDSVTSIGSNPFTGCSALKQIQVSPKHPVLAVIDGVLFSKPDKRLIAYTPARETQEYTIPDGIRGVGDYAFSFCYSLTSVTIPDSVTSIGNNPFAGCAALKQIQVSPRHTVLAVIDGVLFSKPDKRLICYPSAREAQEYAIPNGIRGVGDRAFYDCESLTSITIPDSVTSIGGGAFISCDCLTSITIPDSVTSIGDSAFSYCKSLTSVTIPDGVTSIGDSAFGECNSLTSITIPDSVTSIEYAAFAYCDSLSSVTIPDSVTAIGDGAFYDCDSLSSVTIPDSVTSIGKDAFTGCPLLVLTVERDSYAEQYCLEKDLTYTFPDALDWLKD